MRTTTSTLCLVLGSLLMVACGDDDSTPMDSGTMVDVDLNILWDDMSREQRVEYMRRTVVPEMEALFQEYDPVEYAEFDCVTCHGEDIEEVDFEMPNTLNPLDPTMLPAIFMSSEPEAVFMRDTVWPRMAQLLGRELFNPETNEGFSCLNCHATETGM